MNDQSTNEANDAVSPTVFRGVAAQWLPLASAAAHIGVNAESLRLFVRGIDGRAVLASSVRRSRLCVRPGDAYVHLLKHAPRCRGLVPPPGYEVGARAPSSPQPPAETPVAPDDITDLLRDLTVKIHSMAQGDAMNPDALRAISQSVKTLEDIQTRRDKMLRKVDPDDVVSMLRSLGEIYAKHISETGAARCSARVIRWLREIFEVDLPAQNVEAMRLLEAQLREDAQETITVVQTAVNQKCQGIALLPLEAE